MYKVTTLFEKVPTSCEVSATIGADRTLLIHFSRRAEEELKD